MKIPETLMGALAPVTLVVGHYGVGKTNFSVNLACDLAAEGNEVTVVDLDIVNPYFRASEQRSVLEQRGVNLVAPVFAEAGTSLDVPSLTGRIAPAMQMAGEGRYVIVDVGGDDAGSVAAGRFSRLLEERGYAMLCVLNHSRNLVQDPNDAVGNLREIESACRMRATALVGNTHLKGETTPQVVEEGRAYALEVARLSGLPLVATCVSPELTECSNDADVYRIKMYVTNPWE